MFDEFKKKLSKAIKSITKNEETEVSEGSNVASGAPAQPVQQTARHDFAINDASSSDSNSAAHEETVQNIPLEEQPKSEARSDKHPENAAAKEGDSLKLKLSAATKIKSIFTKEVRLNPADIERFSGELTLSMLQSDVSYATTERFISNLKAILASKGFRTGSLQKEITDCVRSELQLTLEKGLPKIEFVKSVKDKISEGHKPVVIMFLGPNGAGKTTTMAKIAYMLKSRGISSVFSASDTFRAAAIEQTSFHAQKLGLQVIKGNYGSDPASIAFNAVEYAKSHAVDVVLIDTAGRQETNKNLLSEMQKMERVAKPDFTIYVAESTSGNRVTDQIAEFLKYIHVDGIILTKLDCDVKGGNALSISDVTGLPVLFLCAGEGYGDIIEYDPKFIIDALLPN